MGNRSPGSLLVGTLFVGSATVALFLILRALLSGFSTLDEGESAAIVAAAGAILLAIINIVAQRFIERRREVEARQREKKIALYQQFVKFWFDFLLSPESRKARAEGQQDIPRLLPEMNDLTQQIILWASDGVLKRYSAFRRHLTNPKLAADHVATMVLFEKLLLEFRKDLGYANQGIEERDILALFINDIDRLGTVPAAKHISQASPPEAT